MLVVVPLGYFGGQNITVRFPAPVDYKINKAFGGRDDSNHIGSQILVVGEGDFSFTRALGYLNQYNDVFGNLWSTAKDSYYNNRRYENVEMIRKDPKVEVLIGIDGTQLIGSTELNNSFIRCYSARVSFCNLRLGTKIEQPLFNVIFFTFLISSVQSAVAFNIELIHNFFKSATEILQDNGEIRLALQSNQYLKWSVRNSARLCGLTLCQESECHWRNLFNPTYTLGGDWIPINPKWYIFVKITNSSSLSPWIW
jgi:hypothetical protein